MYIQACVFYTCAGVSVKLEGMHCFRFAILDLLSWFPSPGSPSLNDLYDMTLNTNQTNKQYDIDLVSDWTTLCISRIWNCDKNNSIK